MNIDNFIRQHKDIKDEIKHIEEIVNKRNYEDYLGKFVSHINNLAGKLKIHLSTEDRFLYPSLIKEEDVSLKSMAHLYIDEMGSIAEEFTTYKNKYNTKSRLNENMNTFAAETKAMMKKVEKRIIKEENELYKIISER